MEYQKKKKKKKHLQGFVWILHLDRCHSKWSNKDHMALLSSSRSWSSPWPSRPSKHSLCLSIMREQQAKRRVISDFLETIKKNKKELDLGRYRYLGVTLGPLHSTLECLVLVLCTLLSSQLPLTKHSGRSSCWASSSGACHPGGRTAWVPALALVGIWEVNQWVEGLCPSICLSNKNENRLNWVLIIH